MGNYGRFLIMGNAGFISSTVVEYTPKDSWRLRRSNPQRTTMNSRGQSGFRGRELHKQSAPSVGDVLKGTAYPKIEDPNIVP